PRYSTSPASAPSQRRRSVWSSISRQTFSTGAMISTDASISIPHPANSLNRQDAKSAKARPGTEIWHTEFRARGVAWNRNPNLSPLSYLGALGVLAVMLLLRQPAALDQHLGDLDRVGRRALAEIIRDEP